MGVNCQICTCGSGSIYTDCCGRIHIDINSANNALELMRARYVAFVYQYGDFLEISHHPSTRSNFSKRKTYIEKGKIEFIYEHSTFSKDLGYWTYVDYLPI